MTRTKKKSFGLPYLKKSQNTNRNSFMKIVSLDVPQFLICVHNFCTFNKTMTNNTDIPYILELKCVGRPARETVTTPQTSRQS